jgi:hypothetical protein
MSFRKQSILIIFILIAWLLSFWLTAYVWQILPDWTYFPLSITEVVFTIIALISAGIVIDATEDNKGDQS